MNLLELLAEQRGQTVEDVAEALGVEADADDAAVAEALEAERSAAQSRVEELESELEDQPAASEEVLNALELDEDTDKRGILTAIGRLQVESDLSAVRNALELEGEAGTDDMVSAIEELKEGETETRITTLVENAVEAGKVPPAKKDYLLRLAKSDEEAVREIINSVPGQVDMQGGGREPDEGSRTRLTDTEHSVCGQLGVSAEEMAAV